MSVHRTRPPENQLPRGAAPRADPVPDHAQPFDRRGGSPLLRPLPSSCDTGRHPGGMLVEGLRMSRTGGLDSSSPRSGDGERGRGAVRAGASGGRARRHRRRRWPRRRRAGAPIRNWLVGHRPGSRRRSAAAGRTAGAFRRAGAWWCGPASTAWAPPSTARGWSSWPGPCSTWASARPSSTGPSGDSAIGPTAPLDMRMDPDGSATAADIVNGAASASWSSCSGTTARAASPAGSSGPSWPPAR